MISSAKKCDLPEPRPPYAPLYRLGLNRRWKTLAVGICSVDNDALDAMDEGQWIVFIASNGLRNLAINAIDQLNHGPALAGLSLIQQRFCHLHERWIYALFLRITLDHASFNASLKGFSLRPPTANL